MSNPETEQWNTHGGGERGGDHDPILFNKSLHKSMQWSANLIAVPVDDP